ncbi:MAG: QueT transporter family protein [Lachnospiraceae bacterium]|nr:QueT transporter family protein [Lachnospiraceae bacterium]
MRSNKVLFLAQAAIIAALYVVLTLLANALGLANYAIQVRFSEALTILPFFTPAAIPGLFVGCIVSNILTACLPLDTVFGSLATLIGAFGTYLIGHGFASMKDAMVIENFSEMHHNALRKWLCPLPPIIANTIIVPLVLAFVYQLDGTIPYFMLTVGIGEVISCFILGQILLNALMPKRIGIFSLQK